MASLVQQTARSIFFRNFNVLRTITAQQRSFHAISCAPRCALKVSAISMTSSKVSLIILNYVVLLSFLTSMNHIGSKTEETNNLYITC